jgi:hypothetical protein
VTGTDHSTAVPLQDIHSHAVTLNNRSRWRTDHLRAFVERVAAMELTPAATARLVVHVIERRVPRNVPEPYQSGDVSGYAGKPPGVWTGQDVTIRVSPQYIAPHMLALVLAHEMAHLRGIEHPAMTGDARYEVVHPDTHARYAWAWTLPLEWEGRPRRQEVHGPARPRRRDAVSRDPHPRHARPGGMQPPRRARTGESDGPAE